MRQNLLSIEIYDGNHLSNDLFDFLHHTSYSCDTNIQGFSWHSACGSSSAMVTIVTTLCKERSFGFSIYKEIFSMIAKRETWLIIILLE